MSPAQRKALLLWDGTIAVAPLLRGTARRLLELGLIDRADGRPSLTDAGRAAIAEELKPYERQIDWAALRQAKLAKRAAGNR